MTLLKTIEKHHLGIHCQHCNHDVLITVAEIIQKVPEGYTFQQLQEKLPLPPLRTKASRPACFYVTDAAAKLAQKNPRLL